MRRILAIDPGNTKSALVAIDFGADTSVISACLYDDNAEIRAAMMQIAEGAVEHELVIEQIESFGMAVGASVFETCFESGRFAEVWESCSGKAAHRLPRRAVKLYLCNSSKAKDGNVRQAVMDRYGSDRATAIGTKKKPGPLYGISGDQWAALAVALTFHATASRELATRG
jgi:hypothetical protein